MLLSTLSQLNLEGANIKELLRYNGELVVVKKPLQDNCYDNISEVLAYKIAVLLGVPCARAGLLDDERAYSVIDERVKDNLVHACDLLKLDEGSVFDIYDKLERINVSARIKFRFLQMLLFDVLIRQVDRNMTNFSFIIIDKGLDMYELYDNGLSLFSTTKFKSELNFLMRTRDYSDDVLDFCVEKADELHLNLKDLLPKQVSFEELKAVMCPFESMINNSVDDIAHWVVSQKDNIMNKFRGNFREY